MGSARSAFVLDLELVDMATAHASFTFPGNPGFGSGPFVTGFDFSCDSAVDCQSTMENLDEWWTAATAFRNTLDGDLGTPVISTSGTFGGDEFEFAMTATDDPAGSAPSLPGASLRAIKLANRPRGGRRGSMFWPCLEAEQYGTNGELAGTMEPIASTALNGLLASIAVVTGQTMVQVHVIGGVTSTAEVTSWAIAPTVSFLNRRYR